MAPDPVAGPAPHFSNTALTAPRPGVHSAARQRGSGRGNDFPRVRDALVFSLKVDDVELKTRIQRGAAQFDDAVTDMPLKPGETRALAARDRAESLRQRLHQSIARLRRAHAAPQVPPHPPQWRIGNIPLTRPADFGVPPAENAATPLRPGPHGPSRTHAQLLKPGVALNLPLRPGFGHHTHGEVDDFLRVGFHNVARYLAS